MSVFGVFDLASAYQQVELCEDSKALLTINTHKGLFQYQLLPFGVASAPALFQSLTDRIMSGIPHVRCYIDDVIIGGSALSDCKERLEQVLERLQPHTVTLQEEKCKFFQSEVRYLGHRISAAGIHPLGSKIKAMAAAPEPTK